MNIFHIYTRRCLKKNRVRTIVTIIGIILSMTMLTAVVEGANSGMQYLARAEIARTGSGHAVFFEVPADKTKEIAQNKDIEDTTVWSRVGWAEIENSSLSTPYLLIEDMGYKNGDSLMPLHLLDGRLPETEGEILLPANLLRYGDAIETGTVLTLQVGDRIDPEGNTLGQRSIVQEGESLVNTAEKTYTVVGIYARLDPFIEPYDSAGFTAFTCGGGQGPCMVFFTLKHPSRFYDYMQEDCPFDYEFSAHSELLSFCGALRGGSLSRMFTFLMVILLLIVAVGSVLLIYNSFSISVAQRTTQFGILKSMGATKKQIRGSVLYEALLLSCIAIPLGALAGCLGIGVTLYLLRDSFGFIAGSTKVQMGLTISWPGLALSAVLCLLTTLISAWIPARRALQVSPMEAIRSVREVKIRPGEVKTGKLTYRLFGFEGMLAQKNFKRSRRQYRITILSLTLSVVLFLSASAFCAYMEASLTGVTQVQGVQEADILYHRWFSEENLAENRQETLFKELMDVNGVEEGVYFTNIMKVVTFDAADLTREAAKSLEDYDLYGMGAGVYLLFVRDENFAALCKDNGVDSNLYMNPESPLGLVWNKYTEVLENEKGESRLRETEWFARFPASCGYRQIQEILEENGKTWYLYGTEDGKIIYQPEDWDGEEGSLIFRSGEEAERNVELQVGAALKERPFFLEYADAIYLIYPFSAQKAVVGEDVRTTLTYLFMAENHSAVYEDMEERLWDGDGYLYDLTAGHENERAMLLVMRVFSYGFIVLISLIAMANVFNTISTGLMLRRREFAMLRSVGLTQKSFYRMMRYECLIYGIKGLFWGLCLSFGIIVLMYRVTMEGMDTGFFVPWGSVAVAVGSVFAVVFATMLYAAGQMKGDNPVDTLKNENL